MKNTAPESAMPGAAQPLAASALHAPWEDLYALCTGALFVAIAMMLLKAGGVLTGGAAGIALLLSYAIDQPVGVLFMLVNLPFFLFGYFFMGPAFTIKSLVGNAMILGILHLSAPLLKIVYIHPAVAAVLGGTCCGMGILSFARHGAGAGGTTILTLWLMKKYRINAGRTQIAIDSAILLASLATITPGRAGWSALGALATSAMVMAWHRPGRYTGK